MRRYYAILPFVAALTLAATPALAARTGPEIKAQFDAGLAAYDGGDYQKAFALWWDLQFEDVAAMRNVAMMLRKGQGTTKDPKKAEEIYQRAAQAGLPTAQFDLADMLMKGEAGPPDLQSALPLLQAAAAANHPVAQFQLGELYETGAPPLVPQDTEVARQLYAAAATHGMTAATDRLRALPPPPAASAAQTINAAQQTQVQPPEPPVAAVPPAPKP
jgi:TPR repeat protein